MVGTIKVVNSRKQKLMFAVSDGKDYFVPSGNLKRGDFVCFTPRKGEKGWYATNVRKMEVTQC